MRIKRYGVFGQGRMMEFGSGDYVRYEDYLALAEMMSTAESISAGEDLTLRNAMQYEVMAKDLQQQLEVVNARLATRAGEVGVAEAKVTWLTNQVAMALKLLDDAFDDDVDAAQLYDDQGVNQAHRVLSGGEAPRVTKLEGN